MQKRWKDALEQLKQQKIERINPATDACILYKDLGEDACDGSGFVLTRDNERYYIQLTERRTVKKFDENGVEIPIEQSRVCPCMAEKAAIKKRQQALSTARIPEKFKDASFDNYNPDIYTTDEDRRLALYAKRIAQRFVDVYEQLKQRPDKKGLYFMSPEKGTGKTRLIATIANGLIEKGVEVVFINAGTVAKEVRATYSKNATVNELDVLKAFIEAEVLIIDDLAVDKPSRFVEELYYNIFDARMTAGLLTIIASNLSIPAVANLEYVEDGVVYSYTDASGTSRVGDRLEAMVHVVLMPKESIRKKEAKQNDENFVDMLLGLE